MSSVLKRSDLAPDAVAGKSTRRGEPADPAVLRFLDAVWMERGLSVNTLAAYRADLTALSRWLPGRGAQISRTTRADLLGLHRLSGGGGSAAAFDGPSAVQFPPLLPFPGARCRTQGRSDGADRDAEDRPLAAKVADHRRGRVAADGADRHRRARAPRPHDARGSVRDGPACLGTRQSLARPDEPEPGRAAHRGQGQSRASHPARRRSRPLGQRIPAGAARRDPARPTDGFPVSDPARRPHDAPGVLAHHQALRRESRASTRICRRTPCATPSRPTC